jgi:hypothetical protein
MGIESRRHASFLAGWKAFGGESNGGGRLVPQITIDGT